MAKLEIRHADEASFLRQYFISGMSHNGYCSGLQNRDSEGSLGVRLSPSLLKDSSSKRSVKPLANAFAGSNPVCLHTRRHIQVVKGGGPIKTNLVIVRWRNW